MVNIMKSPDATEGINKEVSKVMNSNMEKYKKTAAEWTDKFAT